MGITKNDVNKAKYSYYIETQKSKLVVNIELPGSGSINDYKVVQCKYIILLDLKESKMEN